MKNGEVTNVRKSDDKFDMVIEHNDSDFEDESSGTDESTPTKHFIVPTSQKNDVIKSERKEVKPSIDSRIADERPFLRDDPSPPHRYELSPQADLLEKWEKQYGGKERRQFHTDQEKFRNSWDMEDQKKEQYEPPAKSKENVRSNYKTEDHKAEFDYDWDDDEAHNHSNKAIKKMKKYGSGIEYKSRVPLGGMPYADSQFNKGAVRKLSSDQSELTKISNV
jgi:hypothetical protein